MADALCLREREEIRAGIERSDTDREIGKCIGRHHGTVSREIARNGGRGSYSAVDAHQRAHQNRKRERLSMLEADKRLFDHVKERLACGDSPMTISIQLARGFWGFVKRISHETIYQAIYNGLLGAAVTPRLKRRKRKGRGSKAPGSNSLGIFCSIHDRPAEALERKVVGHLEGDLIVGANNQSALITVFDRASRFLWLATVASKRADDVKTSLCRLLLRMPPHLRLSLAWDQGAELARHRDIWAETGIHIYIADPKSPWQRPTNEQGNGQVRIHVGKGTDLSIYTEQDLRNIENTINDLPRRIFNWATANDKYNQLVAITD